METKKVNGAHCEKEQKEVACQGEEDKWMPKSQAGRVKATSGRDNNTDDRQSKLRLECLRHGEARTKDHMMKGKYKSSCIRGRSKCQGGSEEITGKWII
jgi:hypothetical protein